MRTAPTSKPLRFGIIGAGSIADYHACGLRAAGGAEVVVIAAQSEDSARRAALRLGILEPVGDWRALIARGDIDAVVIATPDDTHREIACAALGAGLHVLLQKPMALTVADCEAILMAARDAKGVFGVSFMHRHFPEVEEARRILGDPTQPLGTVLSARLRNATPGADWGDWFYRRARSGGVVMQLGVHGIDLTQHLFGPIARISAETGLRVRQRRLRDGRVIEPDVEDHAFAIYTMADGVLVSHEMCYAEVAGTDRFALEIICEKGVMHLRGPRGPLAICRAGDADWHVPDVPRSQLGMQQHRAFLAMLRNEIPLDGTPQHALAGMKVVEGIYRSAETGTAVVLDSGAPGLKGDAP